MKKIVHLLGSVAICVALTGCFNNSSDDGGDTTGGTFDNADKEQEYYLEMGKTMDEPQQANDVSSDKSNIVEVVSVIESRAENTIDITKLQPGSVLYDENGLKVTVISVDYLSAKIGVMIEQTLVDHKDPWNQISTINGKRWWEGAMSYDMVTKKLSITELSKWGFEGKKEHDLAIDIIDSSSYEVTYSDVSIDSRIPGASKLWIKNLTPLWGYGDTSYTVVGDIVNGEIEQKGSGTYYNAKLERNFNYDFSIIHKNSVDPSKPYERYQDNEAKVSYTFETVHPANPYDSLTLSVHYFYAGPYTRRVQLIAPDGTVLKSVTGNLETNEWTVE